MWSGHWLHWLRTMGLQAWRIREQPPKARLCPQSRRDSYCSRQNKNSSWIFDALLGSRKGCGCEFTVVWGQDLRERLKHGTLILVVDCFVHSLQVILLSSLVWSNLALPHACFRNRFQSSPCWHRMAWEWLYSHWELVTKVHVQDACSLLWWQTNTIGVKASRTISLLH